MRRIVEIRRSKIATPDKTRDPVTYYTGIGVALGVCFGSAFGAALGDTGVGLALGMAVGVALGAAVGSNKKKKQDVEDLKK
ncbi:glycine zipper domain-containing protein [Pelagibius litoralis]|uniref:glycine zipper domain-containing protein n=1 Tax=Pelagibius litoralis TaxID=374515 RepID=UPI00197D9C1F|nr:glycine zipper domain-containing protein [Pelagibius litoralis]